MKDYVILVNSCDAYKDAWPGFFFFFKKNWPGDFPLIYLNTEEEKYVDDILSVISLESKTGDEWGRRLLNCLNQIDSEFILMMLEDFYYETTINAGVVEQCVEIMKENKNIISFQFVPCGEVDIKGKKGNSSLYSGFVKRDKYGLFKVAAVPTLWRKSDLIRLTMYKDNPWEWEYFGSFRTWLYGKDIYCWGDGEQPIFKYDVEHGGAIHRGKWVGYKIEELSKKYNYDFDIGGREVEYDWMQGEAQVVTRPAYKRVKSIIKNRGKMIIEIIRGFFL